jgi:GT2 family glycosyltransferase
VSFGIVETAVRWFQTGRQEVLISANGNSRTSVVVVTRDRPRELERTISRLSEVRGRPHVIVVDNASSTTETQRVVERYPSVEFLRLPRNIGAAGRNVGAVKSHDEFIAFSDDDSWWAEGSISRAEELFDAYPKLAAVTGSVLVGPTERPDEIDGLVRRVHERDAELPGIPVLGFLACAVIVRRSAFLAVGGFERRFGTGGEEQLLAIDLAARGWGIAWVEDVVAYHYPSRSRDLTSRRVAEVRNALWTTWLRRSIRRSVLATLPVAARCRDGLVRRALLEASIGLPWILRSRRTVPKELERRLLVLERARGMQQQR